MICVDLTGPASRPVKSAALILLIHSDVVCRRNTDTDAENSLELSRYDRSSGSAIELLNSLRRRCICFVYVAGSLRSEARSKCIVYLRQKNTLAKFQCDNALIRVGVVGNAKRQALIEIPIFVLIFFRCQIRFCSKSFAEFRKYDSALS